jgi:NAD(P)-dependent dehydrogenase (short-subunit alcohol dehydrogenase family)
MGQARRFCGWACRHKFGMDKEAAIDHFAKEVRKLPLGRLGKPEEIAYVVVFLASDQAGFVTGAEIRPTAGPFAVCKSHKQLGDLPKLLV